MSESLTALIPKFLSNHSRNSPCLGLKGNDGPFQSCTMPLIAEAENVVGIPLSVQNSGILFIE